MVYRKEAELPKIRFTSDGVYRAADGPYDESQPQFDCVWPAMDDNGQYSIVDCWITDSHGNIHPGYNVSPVPVVVENIGEMVKHISS
ncbi:MAG: hypothetical protein ACLPX5_00925 [Dissulfurispiraceae bacterium]